MKQHTEAGTIRNRLYVRPTGRRHHGSMAHLRSNGKLLESQSQRGKGTIRHLACRSCEVGLVVFLSVHMAIESSQISTTTRVFNYCELNNALETLYKDLCTTVAPLSMPTALAKESMQMPTTQTILGNKKVPRELSANRPNR